MFWVIQAQENPAAPRTVATRREWRSNTLSEGLADRGHEVVRWRSSFSHQAKVFLADGSPRIPIDNYSHQFIDCPPYQRHIGVRRILNHRALGRNFTQVAQGYGTRPKVIHVGNVPIDLCHAAVHYGVASGVPVVIDVRDLWPDIYADLLPAVLRPAAVRVLDLSARKLKWAFAHATAITGLTESYLNWGLEKAGRARRPQDAVFPMSYPCRDDTPSPEGLAALRERLGLSEGDVVASYLGNIGHQSDFDTVIAAARRVAPAHPQFKVVIAGSGPLEAPLRAAAQDLPNVIVPGWLEGPELSALMHLSQIGLIAYKPVPNFLRNIPNKFSEYLAGGLAVACGLEGEMGTLTRETGCGFVYLPGDAEGLATQFDQLLCDGARMQQMSRAARALHRDRFDGAQIYPAFATYLEEIAAQGGGHE